MANMALTLFLLLTAVLSKVTALTAASPAIWPSQHYVTEDFTAPELNISRNGDTVPGYLFLTPIGDGTDVNAPVIISDSNQLIWRGPAGGWTYENFKVQQLHGQPVLTTWYGNSSATFGHGYGAVQIWNASYAEVHRICPPGLNLVTPNHEVFDCYLDQHESYLTDHGTIITTAYNVTQTDLSSVGGPSDGWVFNSLFFEIDVATQKVLFRWRSLDHLPKIPLTESHYPLKLAGAQYGVKETSPWDYFHINSIQPLSDGYLVDSRHLYSIYKVSETGDIEWHLSGLHGGDFTLDPDVYFSWQHMPRVLNVTSSSLHITLFNNDNSEAQVARSNGSTGLSLFVNLKTMHVSLDHKLNDRGESIIASSQGSYQQLEQSHVLLGYGQIATTREFDAKGKVVYEAQYGYSNDTSQAASYRSFRQQWSAKPFAAPKLAVVCHGTEGAALYMSWNGATAYTHWTVYVGNSIGELVPAATIARNGFETQYTVQGVSHAKVVARAGGRVLGNSTTVEVTC